MVRKCNGRHEKYIVWMFNLASLLAFGRVWLLLDGHPHRIIESSNHRACLHRMSQTYLNYHHTGEPPWYRRNFAWEIVRLSSQKSKRGKYSTLLPTVLQKPPFFVDQVTHNSSCFTCKSNALLKFETLQTWDCKRQTANCSLQFAVSNKKPGAKGL